MEYEFEMVVWHYVVIVEWVMMWELDFLLDLQTYL